MARKWGYLALLVSVTTLGVCFAVHDDKAVGDSVTHGAPVAKDSDSFNPPPPDDSISHVVPRPPPDDDYSHENKIQPSDIPSSPMKHASSKSNDVSNPPPVVGGRIGAGGGGYYCYGHDCIGTPPIYGQQPPPSPSPSPPSPSPLPSPCPSPSPPCQPATPPPSPPLCQPNPPPSPPPCSQPPGGGWGQPGGGFSGKGMMMMMRPDKENVFYGDYMRTVKQLVAAMQELTEAIKNKAA